MSIRLLTTLGCVVLASLYLNAQRNPPNGTWIGQLTGEVDVDMVFHFSGTSDDLSCILDIPTYQIADLAADVARLKGDSLIVSWQIGAAFKGVFTADNRVSGTWYQPAGNLPLTIEYSTKGFAREQEPVAPFPYQVQDLEFKSGETTLRGILSIPKTEGPYKLIVMLSPSGPQNRDGEMYGHKPQLVVADRLTKAGIAVFRMDDRGVEGSDGALEDMTVLLQAQDGAAAVNYLRNMKTVDFSHIGIMGFGEGGSAGIVLASQRAVDFLVTAGTAGVSYSEILIASSLEELQKSGASAQDITRDTTYARSVYDLMNVDGKLVDTASLRKLATGYYDASPLLRARFPDKEQFVQSQFRMTSNSWFGSIAAFQPSAYVRKIACPAMIAYGAEDSEVLLDRSVVSMNDNLRKAPTQTFNVVVIPGLNHLFQPISPGQLAEYSMIGVTFDEGVIKEIGDWISELK